MKMNQAEKQVSEFIDSVLNPRMTAVEFIISMCEGKEHTPFESNRELAFMLGVALRMERKQIINAYENLDYDDGNEYYNATFDNKIKDQ